MRVRIWTVFMVLAAAVSLTSCTWMYMDSDDTAHIEAKRSIRPFSHLKEPIVVTMPVYSNRHLFGNKSWDSMQDQKGDIFVVIDLATDTVWDWIFFPGKHGWTNWRCVEAGSSPTLYCSAGMGSGLVGCLDPTKTTLDVYNAGTKDVVRSYSTPGDHIIIPDDYYDQGAETLVYRINSFNVRMGRMEGSVEVPTDSIGYFDHPQADPEGNYWFAYPFNDENCIRMYDVSTNTLGDIVVKLPVWVKNISTNYICHVDHVDAKYIIGSYCKAGAEPNLNQQLFLIDRKQGWEPTYISIPDELDSISYFYETVEINGKYYGIHPNEIREGYIPQVHLSEIDLEKKEIHKVATVDIDMTETVYVRGSRLYLMKSRNISDIYYTYYDFATGETGRMVNIKYEDVVK